MTQIFYSYIVKENHDKLVKEIAPLLPVNFQNKISGYRRWQDAQLSLLGRIILSQGLKKMNKNISINDLRYTTYNKPYFENDIIKFNISHSGNMVVCAISDTFDIGIDLEIINNTVKIEDYKSQMTVAEWQQVMATDNNHKSFFDYWTQKEAVMKAHGKGHSIPIKSFEIINYQAEINKESFFLEEIKLEDNYICYLACKSTINTIVLHPPIVDFSI